MIMTLNQSLDEHVDYKFSRCGFWVEIDRQTLDTRLQEIELTKPTFIS